MTGTLCRTSPMTRASPQCNSTTRGYIQNLTDKKQRVCYEARVLMDDGFAVINQTRMLVEANCLPIDVAAQVALKGLCTEAAP
jgi:hypothetical protein